MNLIGVEFVLDDCCDIDTDGRADDDVFERNMLRVRDEFTEPLEPDAEVDALEFVGFTVLNCNCINII